MMTGLTIICYISAWCFLLQHARKKSDAGRNFYLTLTAGLIAHVCAAWGEVLTSDGVQLGVFQIASVLCVVMNGIAALSALRHPLSKIFLLLLPLAVGASAAAALIHTSDPLDTNLNAAMIAHILLSIVAYSLLAIATLQALLLHYQLSQLKAHHARSVMGVFPPLQTMESLMFDMVRAGFVLLTLSIVTGMLFIYDLRAQHLSHKTVFSLISWVLYIILLFGRHILGWRGKVAVRWLLASFVALMLAYFGSKFVLEVLLR